MGENVDVNGSWCHAIYTQWTQAVDQDGRVGDIQWNCEKFVIDADGLLVQRFSPQMKLSNGHTPPDRQDAQLKWLLVCSHFARVITPRPTPCWAAGRHSASGTFRYTITRTAAWWLAIGGYRHCVRLDALDVQLGEDVLSQRPAALGRQYLTYAFHAIR